MAIDWPAHYDSIYSDLGVPVTIVLADTAGTDAELTVRDMTVGEEVGFNEVGVATIMPVARVRMTELTENGLAAADLAEATLTMNGKDWTVKSWMPKPAPTGEAEGELRLILEQVL